MNKMKKLWWAMFVLCFCCTGVSAQKTIDVTGDIMDEYLNMPLKDVKISLLNPDSTVVVDSATTTYVTGTNGKLLQVIYNIPVKAEERDFLIRATRPGYNEVWQPITVRHVDLISAVRVPTIKMRKEMSLALSEVKVTATKVKMYYKGDTLVYDADAFKLPDGSMLDALIRQLPGVTLNDAGEIFVNGRKVDELLLGSRTFFRGNKKVLMENLPYYTVKDLKVYEKQTAKSEALGYDVEPRRYVMDVNLRPEYSQGYIANVEAAGGTEERYLGRAFLLGFTDQWRYSLLGNLNNVNETRHAGEQGHWTPTRMPQSIATTRSVATDLDYQSKDKKTSNTFNADFTSVSNDMQMRQRSEQFLEGRKPVSLSNNHDHSRNWKIQLHNTLQLSKPAYLYSQSHFTYARRDGRGATQFDQWDEGLTASMHTDAISEGQSWDVTQELQGAFNINASRKQHISYYIVFNYNDDQSWISDRYDTWQANTQAHAIRHNANDVEKRRVMAFLSTHYTHPLTQTWKLTISEDLSYVNTRDHDYLYHPDTLLLASQLDMLTAITDPSNSYDSHYGNLVNTMELSAGKSKSYKIGDLPYSIWYDQWRFEIKVPVRRQSLDYQRGMIDTLIHQTDVYVNPNVAYRYMSPDGKRDLRINAEYKFTPASLTNQIGYRDDSRPLVVKLGNPGLKGTAMTSADLTYSEKYLPRMTQWHVGASFNYRHRDVAQSVGYDPATGVYTYKPMNVSGAYSASADATISRAFDEKGRWTWQMNADANFRHDVDHTMLAGETESHENAVNTTTLHDAAYVQYNKDALNVRLSGDIRWRHSTGRMLDFETLDALDYRYGLSARYTLPRLKTTLSADGTMYSRRGYGSAELNTDDFVLNASLSQPFLKGKLIARIEAFDLLHQLSSTQYSVNAQGRTETWYRSLPHYVMFHLVYHWNRNPKR